MSLVGPGQISWQVEEGGPLGRITRSGASQCYLEKCGGFGQYLTMKVKMKYKYSLSESKEAAER